MTSPAARGQRPRIAIEFWADIVSPWCYVAKRRLEHAIAAFEWPHEVEILYRSFELDPAIPVGGGVSIHDHLAQRHAWGMDQVKDVTARATEAATADDLVIDLSRAVRANTFDAHRMVQLGRAQGGLALQGAVLERLFHAHFAEGKAIDDREVLQRLGPEAGLDERRLAAVLASQSYVNDVRADEELATELGVTEVPHVFANRRVTASQMQPVETYLELLRSAWEEASPAPLGDRRGRTAE